MTEEEIRSAVCKSQREGFKALFTQYRRYVYSIIWRRIRNVGTAEDAEECLSDVFTHVFVHFDEINEGSLQAYISTVASRMAVDRFRSLSSAARMTSDEEIPDDLRADTDIAGELERSDRDRILYERIRSLGEPDSSLIIQRYYYERSSKDIASSFGMTPVAVRVRLNRALKRLRKMLTDGGEEL